MVVEGSNQRIIAGFPAPTAISQQSSGDVTQHARHQQQHLRRYSAVTGRRWESKYARVWLDQILEFASDAMHKSMLDHGWIRGVHVCSTLRPGPDRLSQGKPALVRSC